MALVVVLLWWQLDDTEVQIRNHASALFFMSIYWGFNPIFNSVIRTQTERPLLRKERQSGTFRLSAYFLTNTMATFVCQAVSCFLFVTLAYWAIGLRPEISSFVVYLAVILLNMCVACVVGHFFGFAIENPAHAAATASVYMLSVMLCTGFYIEREAIPGFLRILPMLGFTTYSWNALLLTEFDDSDTTYECASASS